MTIQERLDCDHKIYNHFDKGLGYSINDSEKQVSSYFS